MCTLAVTPSVLEFLSLFRYRTCNISWPLSHNFPIVFAVVYPFFFQFIYGRMASAVLGLLAKQMAKPLGPVEPPTGPRRNQNNFQSDQHFGLYCKNKREHVGSHDRNRRTRARQCLTTARAVILQCTVKARALTGSSPDRTAMLANDVMVFVTSARTDSVVSSREHCV